MRLLLALALTLGAIHLSAADSARTSPTLDVVVEDSHGKAIDTLKQSDFTVTEQSRAIAIESVRFVRAERNGAAAMPASATPSDASDAAGRVIAIYLDEFHVAPGPAADRARAALIRLVNADAEAGAQVIVLQSLQSLRDTTPVSDRRDAILKLESFSPRRGDYEPRTSFERNFIAGTPARVEIARAQIATSSLEALATELGRLSSERKTLIVVSEGFVKNGRRRGDDMLPSLDSVMLAANRAHVSIYPCDPSAEARAAANSDGATDASNDAIKWREALRLLATGTAGRTIDSDNLDVGL